MPLVPGGGRSLNAVTWSPFSFDDTIAGGIVQMAEHDPPGHLRPIVAASASSLEKLQSNRESPLHSRKRSCSRSRA